MSEAYSTAPSPTCDYEPFEEYSERYTLLWEAPDLIASTFARTTKLWEGTTDVTGALDVFHRIADGNQPPGLDAVVLNGSHLLLYSLAAPWWNPTEVWLSEQFFIRIGRGPTACAFAAIEQLASDLGASHIVMATGLAKSDEALGKLYSRFGYSQQSTQHVKEAKWLQSLHSSP